MDRSLISRTKLVCQISLLLVLLSCRVGTIQSGKPLRITNVSVSPDPVVGRIVTLTVEIETDSTASDISLTIDTRENFGNKVHLVSGDASWQGFLGAKESKTIPFSLCAGEEGYWPVDLVVYSPSLHDGDLEIIYLVSTITSGKLDSNVSPKEIADRPTPRPVKVSPECSGLSE